MFPSSFEAATYPCGFERLLAAVLSVEAPSWHARWLAAAFPTSLDRSGAESVSSEHERRSNSLAHIHQPHPGDRTGPFRKLAVPAFDDALTPREIGVRGYVDVADRA